MKELRYGRNIFLLPKNNSSEAAVVTTNGMCRANGRAVMGAGIAKYVRDNMNGSDLVRGVMLKLNGNHAYLLGRFQDPNRLDDNLDPWVSVITMPTKHDWREPSTINLIARSAHELIEIADKNHLSKIYLPAPGCNHGGLDYAAQVRPVIAKILDPRFVVCLTPSLYDKLHP